MYRRYLQLDELFSQALVLFTGALFFGFLISWKLVGVDTWDAEMIVYVVCGSLFALLFLFWMVIIALQPKRPLMDIAIDRDEETIHIFYGLKKYSFDQIKLIAYNKRHKQLRLLVGRTLVGFKVDELLNDNGDALQEDDVSILRQHAVLTEPKVLYNYPLLVSTVFIALIPIYALLYAKDGRAIVGSLYIPMYYVLALVIVLILAAYWIGVWAWTRLYHNEIKKQEH